MNKRIISVDALRGLSVTGMVFCACIGWNSGLPAWMFHCQVPPPDYAFHPEVRGITWVDLVFPIFLFALGLAIPIAIRSRLAKGMSRKMVALSQLKRFVILACFAVVLGNAYNIGSSELPDVWKIVFMPAVWTGFFLSLWRTPGKWVNPLGYAILAALLCIEHFVYKVPVSCMHTDVIIMILANVALGGAIIYLLTAQRPQLLSLAWAMAIAVKAVASYTPVFGGITTPAWLAWLINPDFLQYLVIVLPGIAVGESLCTDRDTGSAAPRWKHIAAAALLFITFAVQLWGFFSRNIIWDACITLALAASYRMIAGRMHPAFALLMLGIAFDPIDGGIAKDYCNLSYLFATGAMAWMMLDALRHLESLGAKMHALALCGQNPMIAYTVTKFIIIPVFSACTLMQMLSNMAQGSIVGGLVQGLVLTAAMCLCTGALSYKKIFWRS